MPPETLASEIQTGTQSLGLHLSDRQADQLAQFADLLLTWNQKINLISRATEPQIVSRHIIDSLAPAAYLQSHPPPSRGEPVVSLSNRGQGEGEILAADLGSGGGLPGIPLKIVAPHWEMTLIEPTLKKGAFLKTAIDQLGLEGIQVVAEHIARRPPAGLARHFDLVVSRATLPIPQLIPITTSLLNRGGRWIAMVSQKQAADFGTGLVTWPYRLPDGSTWSLLVSRKIDPSGP